MHDRCPILIGQQSTYCESASCPCRHQYWCQVGMWMKDAGRNDILLTFYWVLVKGLRQALRWDNRKDDVSSYLTPKLLGSDWINRPQWIKKKKGIITKTSRECPAVPPRCSTVTGWLVWIKVPRSHHRGYRSMTSQSCTNAGLPAAVRTFLGQLPADENMSGVRRIVSRSSCSECLWTWNYIPNTELQPLRKWLATCWGQWVWESASFEIAIVTETGVVWVGERAAIVSRG